MAEGGIKFSPAVVLIAGLCFGMAFEFRFQIAFAVMGVMGWILFRSAESWRSAIGKLALMGVGVAVPIVVGTLIDRWGYGEWTIVPWNYFHKDVLEGRPSLDGTQPFWWYLVGINSHLLAPITLVWTIATLVSWIRHPRHIITWATLLFFIAHSGVEIAQLVVLAQKDDRQCVDRGEVDDSCHSPSLVAPSPNVTNTARPLSPRYVQRVRHADGVRQCAAMIDE